MAVAITSYEDVQSVLNAFYQTAGVSPATAPHHIFWQSLTYEQFVTGDVPNVGKEYGGPYKILVKGNSAASNIINALEGTPGGPFDPTTGIVGQMPQPNPPYQAAVPPQSDLIAGLKGWIDKGCPQFAPTGARATAKPKPLVKPKVKPRAKLKG
jgi:hypothetical protein